MTATVKDLIRLKKTTKVALCSQLNVSYQSMHKWVRDPAQFIKIERSYEFDEALRIPKGTTMDVIMGRHTTESLTKQISK